MNYPEVYMPPNVARGPWDHEVDRLEWRDPATKLNCMIIRNSMGVLCGYVGVGPEHPDYGKGYDDVDVEVHGGLTYAAECAGHICHVPQPGEPEHVYWFGFDCGHWRDLVPALAYFRGKYGLHDLEGGHYRDLRYVKQEVTHLAAQLKARA